MIAIAQVIIEDKEQISGLLVSEDTGLRWRMVLFFKWKAKKDVKEFRILDYGSILVVIDKEDTFL